MHKILIGSLRSNAKTKKGLHIRCDRLSPLGNPFPIGINNSRTDSIKAYADNWNELIANSKAAAYFNFIKEQSKKRDIVLMCWCAPLACHCDIIKAKLEE